MPFKSTLNQLLEDIPGAIGVIISDWEGEAVDQVARINEYEIKVLGAHKGIILNQLRDILSNADYGGLQEIMIRTEHNKTLIVPLSEDYFLVLSLEPGAILARASYRLQQCVEHLRSEFD
jgi:predicted regulator of Ras-like GTPase activity (Roadblock/LC7/MglB family)